MDSLWWTLVRYIIICFWPISNVLPMTESRDAHGRWMGNLNCLIHGHDMRNERGAVFVEQGKMMWICCEGQLDGKGMLESGLEKKINSW